MTEIKTAFEVRRSAYIPALIIFISWSVFFLIWEYENQREKAVVFRAVEEVKETSFQLGVECGTAALELKKPNTPRELLEEARKLRDSL